MIDFVVSLAFSIFLVLAGFALSGAVRSVNNEVKKTDLEALKKENNKLVQLVQDQQEMIKMQAQRYSKLAVSFDETNEKLLAAESRNVREQQRR